ncbi:hypothetical protein ACTXT7_003729 [Hymenolepis weldensis]
MNVVTIPCVILISPTTALIANFGQREFSFAIAQHIAHERCSAVTQAIEDKLTADLANVEMQSLVFDYLMRNGYLATANAMTRPSIVPRSSINSKAAALNDTDSTNPSDAITPPPGESSNSKLISVAPISLSLKPQDMINGIADKDASDSNSPNFKSSPTQLTAPQDTFSSTRYGASRMKNLNPPAPFINPT